MSNSGRLFWGTDFFAKFAEGIRKAMTVEQETIINRIQEMESRFDEASRILAELEGAISQFNDFKEELDILREYMDSGQWQADFEADEAGLVPQDLKRGVISEDALYDLLQEADALSCIVPPTEEPASDEEISL